jgi:hypothetical protein
MTCIQYLFAVSVLCSLFVSSTTLGGLPKKRCVLLTRASVEEKFGRPVKCLDKSKDVECFGHEGEPVRVQFNTSGLATKIEISTGCNGIQSLIKVLNESVPKNTRGKYRPGVEPAGHGCQTVYEEEYACLRMTSTQENCMGCAPASITMIWK